MELDGEVEELVEETTDGVEEEDVDELVEEVVKDL